MLKNDRLIGTVFEHPKQVLTLKLMDGIVSPVCLIGKRFSYYVMDAHKSRLLGDGYYTLGTQEKWMDLRISPILRTLFDRCDI